MSKVPRRSAGGRAALKDRSPLHGALSSERKRAGRVSKLADDAPSCLPLSRQHIEFFSFRLEFDRANFSDSPFEEPDWTNPRGGERFHSGNVTGSLPATVNSARRTVGSTPKEMKDT